MGHRFSLLGKFSGLSLLAMVVLGVTVGFVLQDRIEARALRNAEQLTEIFNRVVVAPNLTRADLDGPLPAAQLVMLDRALAGIQGGDVRLDEVNLFAADGTTVYSDDRERIGEVSESNGFATARAGELFSKVERETGDHGEAART